VKPRSCAWVVVCVCVASALAGCGEQRPSAMPPLVGEEVGDGSNPAAGFGPIPGGPSGIAPDREGQRAIIDGVVQLIKAAPTNPGGQNFTQAVERLNQFFEASGPEEFALSAAARDYLATRLGPQGQPVLAMLERREWNIQDARHIEDCMLYQAVARRVAGEGDDLTRVRRVFDWIVRQIELVPAGALAGPDLPQVPVRPYDVLLRGMATENGDAYWAERGWLFMALCRQLGVDAGLLTYTPRSERGRSLFWVCGALIDGQVYLFDTRIGLPIPGPGGQGVATLEQAIADPEILNRLDLPGEVPYMTTAADLAASPIGVMIDSSPGYLSPRMRSLEKSLVGRNRVTLHRDPAEQQEAFAKALGRRFGGAELWQVPMEVFVRLFGDGEFVRATQYPMTRFDARFPLLPARMAQLRGETAEAIHAYILLRFRENPVENDGKTPIPPVVQKDLDLYATYFLGLAQLEAEEPGHAEKFFRQALELLPEPGQNRTLCALYRWGVRTNLAFLAEARGDLTAAVRDYCAPTGTFQDIGNRLRARDLIWRDPFAREGASPPSAPASSPESPAASAPAAATSSTKG
jgi:hypothetical protein